MCQYKYKIYNKWTRSTMYVDCGHCPACLMEKANARLRRIKNSFMPGYTSLFVTLTYAPDFLPYVSPDDVYEGMAYLPIRRDYDMKKVRVDENYNVHYVKIPRFEPLEVKDCFEEKIFYDGCHLPRARGSRNKIGVLYFKDLQDFCKRLERNLFRHYSIPGSSYKMYKISELGETYFRPHFHLLIHVPSQYLAQFQQAVSASWPFDNQNMERQIEIAKNPSSYLSRYLCRPSDFPRFFEHKCFKPKSSFSKGFGLANENFSLSNLLQAVDDGDMRYDTVVCRDSKTTSINLFYPKYFVNRYFFKFKGYSRLTPSQILLLVRFPVLIYTYGQRLGYTVTEERNDYENTIRILRNRFARFCAESGISGRSIDLQKIFAFYYNKVWAVYASTVYKHMFDNVENDLDMLECYENVDDVRNSFGNPVSEIKTGLMNTILKFPEVKDPNFYRRTVSRSTQLSTDYFSHVKKRKITNTAYQENGMWI